MSKNKEYAEREELVEFLKVEIQQCEAELAESDGEDDRYEQAVESRMLGLVEVLRKVTNTTPADVAEVCHGEWIEEEQEVEFYGCIDKQTFYRCSLCGRYEDKQEPYCNCGAKMDGSGEG